MSRRVRTGMGRQHECKRPKTLHDSAVRLDYKMKFTIGFGPWQRELENMSSEKEENY